MAVLHFLDRIFSVLPLPIVVFHALCCMWTPAHRSIMANIVFTYLLGFGLKLLFCRDRRLKSYEFKPIAMTHHFHRVKTHYGFPSSHAMFYFQYFLLRPSLLTLAVFIAGASLRILREHHTTGEVLWGCAFVLIAKIAIVRLCPSLCALAGVDTP
ncbi:hypothetical protein PAPHI01_1917 [Pancytospora philotis]|nr:hypothetical protein PAPHI01_1917 [Pancytospora philotis]